VITCGAAIGGTVHVTGNVAGWVGATNCNGEDGLKENALIDIDGNLSGYVTVTEDAVGDIEIGGGVTSTGQIIVHGDMAGDIEADDISGSLSIGGNAYSGTATFSSVQSRGVEIPFVGRDYGKDPTMTS